MITVTLQNSDLADLFLWVYDKNKVGEPAVVSGTRLNEDDRIEIQVQENGEGEGLIRWLVKRTDPGDDKSEEKDNIRVEDGAIIDVSAY